MLKKVAVEDLRLGMYLVEFCGSWTEHPFWRERFLLKSANDLEKIRASSIREVWIDSEKGLDIDGRAPVKEISEASSAESVLCDGLPEKVTLKQSYALDCEVREASRLCSESKKAIIEMFRQARMENAVKIDEAHGIVSQITESVVRNPHALISLARLKSANEYTYMHSIAVCGLMIGLARQLGLSGEMVNEAGMAGLLHDLGKMAVPLDILDKPGRLTDDEFRVIYQHPEWGARILEGCQNVSSSVIDVCLHHHEKVDGTGYPDRLAGEQISLLGRMAAVCDVYDALTSDRPYKKGWGPAEAIKKMAEWEGHFDKAVFQSFVKFIGIYPVGSLVRLESSKLAVVIAQSPASLLKPVVKVFFSIPSSTLIPTRILDLGAVSCNDRIVARESLRDWEFKNLEKLWAEA